MTAEAMMKECKETMQKTMKEMKQFYVSDEFKQMIEAAVTKAVEKQIKEVQKKIDELEEKVDCNMKKLEEENRELKKRMNETEQYSRRSNIEIKNIPERPNEDLKPIILDIAKKINMPLDFKCDVQAAHRIPTKPGLTKPIIVKFTNRQFRNDFIFQAKKAKLQCNQLDSTKDLLFSANTKIFVNDHLTAANKKLFFEARQCVKNRTAKSAWTVNGKIMIRRDDASGPITIRDEYDLRPFQKSYSDASRRT